MRQANRFPKVLLMVCALLVMLIGVALEMSGWGILPGAEAMFPNVTMTRIGGIVVIAAGLFGLMWSLAGKRVQRDWGIQHRIALELETWNAQDDQLSRRQRAVHLILASFLGLFFELALIRWLGTEIKVFAYLKNVVLIAAFLGMGLGFFLARRSTNSFPLFLPMVTAFSASVLVGVAMGLFTKIVVPSSEQIVLLGLSFSELNAAPWFFRLISWIPYYAVTIFYFVLVTAVFVPLGQYIGKCMRSFAPIPGYSLNLLGSLAGTLLFTFASFAWLPPVSWFAIVGVVALWQLRYTVGSMRWTMIATAILFPALIFLMPNQPGIIVWSPYNQIVVSPESLTDSRGQTFPWGYQISVGEYYFYQDLIDLSTAFFQAHPDLPKEYRNSGYEVPYKFIQPTDVALLGAGGGNDAAAALRNGAQHIDAIDIDPAILQTGQEFHPEHPYASPLVQIHADDARSFVKRAERRYDLVSFGFLDSFQVISAFGSVRLDNFVYTVEGMRDAFALVKPGGILSVAFTGYAPWILQRINGLVETATGRKPLALSSHQGMVFLVRNGEPFSQSEIDSALTRLESVIKQTTVETGKVPLTTDDWPYLYLDTPQIPLAYWTILPILGVLAFWLTRRVTATQVRIQWHFFFLGAGFLLMEVRVIGQIALLFGSTWIVNVVAISTILLMALISNGLVAVRQFDDVRPWGILLLITLAISSLVPSSAFLNLGLGLGGVLAALMLALPVFFSGIVFSTSFRKTTQVDVALASNLAGAILGGFIEYASLLWGIGSLAWLAATLYALALLSNKSELRF